MYYIYCYKNKINDKRYIGKTNNISRRRSAHRRHAFVDNDQKPFYKALRKYGEANFEFSILDKFEYEWVIWDLEIFYIKGWQTTNPSYGYNLSLGGEGGTTGVKHNEKQILVNKSRVGEKNKNSKLDKETVLQIYADYKFGDFFYTDLAVKYNVSPITIERILSGKSWKHLSLDIGVLYKKKRKNITRGYMESANE